MRTKRILLVSCAIILICLTIIIGVTYSLYTDRFIVGNHLVAGDLNISLQRTYLEYKSIDEKGVHTTKVDDTIFDFSDATTDNIFGLHAGDLRIAPGSYFEAKMRILNDNRSNAQYYSNVAFTYSVEIVLVNGSHYFADQMQVTVTDHNGVSTTMRLDEVANGRSFEVGKLLAGEVGQDFTVRVEFLDDVDYPEMNNNLVQGEELVFDLVVTAVQATD